MKVWASIVLVMIIGTCCIAAPDLLDIYLTAGK